MNPYEPCNLNERCPEKGPLILLSSCALWIGSAFILGYLHIALLLYSLMDIPQI